MRQNKTIYLLILMCLLIVSLVFIPSALGGGLGVGPNYIRLPNAFKGDTSQRTIKVYNENDYNTTIVFSSTGELQNWVSFYETTNITEPVTTTFMDNNSIKDIILKIAIPEDTPNGEYDGTVIVTSLPEETNISDRNVTKVNLSIPIILSINVTGEQNLNISVLRIYVTDAEIPLQNSFIGIEFQNTGNVLASPNVQVSIQKAGTEIDRLLSSNYSFSPIQIGEIGNYTMMWNTSDIIQAGTYKAFIDISLDGTLIHSENKTFELFPPGTLSRNGTLYKMGCMGTLKKDKVVRIDAIFRNTGEIATSAQFQGEVFRDGELIEIIESDEIIVPIYQEKILWSYLTIKENGRYRISGHVMYDGRQTNTLDLEFEIGVFSLDAYSNIIIIAVICFIIIIIILYLVFKTNHLKNIKPLFQLQKTVTPRSIKKGKKPAGKKSTPTKTKSRAKRRRRIKVNREKLSFFRMNAPSGKGEGQRKRTPSKKKGKTVR